MSRKIEYLTGSLGAIEQLRVDVETGQMKLYTLPEFPGGIFHLGYADNCYSFAAGVSGSGNFDYLVVLALRPDKAFMSNDKVIDIDTAAFCFKSNDLEAFPTGSAFFHQKFDGRVTPLPGYEGFTLDQTINDLHSKLIPGAIPFSGAPQPYLNAFSHSVAHFNRLLGPQVTGWYNAPASGGTASI